VDRSRPASPVNRARRAAAEILPVLEPLAPLLPGGGLARGTIVETDKASVPLALAAGPTYWAAALDLPDLG
jgi:hypothetical protein